MSALAISRLAAHAPISSSSSTVNDHLDDDVVATFTRLKPSIIALPIGLSDSQLETVTNAARTCRATTTDHLSAYCHTITFSTSTNILFLDLTPDQTAAKQATIDIDDDGKHAITVETAVRSKDTITAENVLGTLVDPIVAPTDDIHHIFIYGTDAPDILSALHTRFPTSEPVSLADIVRGAAELIRPPTDILATPVVLLPVRLATAGGHTARLVPSLATLPLLRTALFTNSSDAQTTATLQLVRGVRARVGDNIPGPTVVLHGLTATPKGTAHIQVSLAIDLESVGVLTVEQLVDEQVVFSKVVKLPTILKISAEAYSRHVDEAEGEFIAEDETPALPM